MQKTIDMLENEDIGECEIVLINDGSSDDTLEIIENNTQKYENIKYISRENKGVSVSRNDGIKIAQGKYIYFLDSDDEIPKDTIKYFKERIKNSKDFDLIAFGYKMVNLNGEETYYVNHRLNGTELKNEQCADLFFRGLLFIHICSVLLKRDFVLSHNLHFEEGIRIGEDYDFLRKATLFSNNSFYDDRVSFLYKRRIGSATNGRKEYGPDSFQSLLLTFKTIELAKSKLKEKTINYYISARYSAHLFSYLRSSYKSNEVNKFFINNKKYLYRSISKGRWKVMMAIYLNRILSVRLILSILKKNSNGHGEK